MTHVDVEGEETELELAAVGGHEDLHQLQVGVLLGIVHEAYMCVWLDAKEYVYGRGTVTRYARLRCRI